MGAARRFSCTTCGAETTGDDAAPAPEVWLQTGVDRFRAFGRPSGRLWGHARLRSAPGEPTLVADVRLLDNAGTVLAEVIGQQAQRVNQERLLRPAAASAGSFYEVRWLARPRTHSSVAQVAGLQASQGSAQALAHSATCQEHPAAWQAAGSTLTSEVRELLSQGLDTQVAQPEIVSYAALLKELESLSVLYIGRALTRMGWSQRPGDRLAADDLIRGLRVQATRTRLFGRLLEILAAEGCLRREGKQWEVLSELPGGDLPRELDRIRRQYPAPQAELDLLDRCGSNLADVLQGRCDPLELIFPGGDLTMATRVYHDSPGARAINSVLREGVRRAVERLPVDARLRVLEIGAGTGGTTAYVLPALPADRVEEYVFTDISRRFLSAAKEKFAEYPFVRFEVLDIERSPAEQGFPDAKFDMVVASNVLHATRHLSTTVRHASQLMAAGGLLWLLENTAPSRWVDLIWGLTDGWWRFDDPWRTSQPLLDTDGWRRLLRENGCPTVECIAADPRRHEVVSRQTILLAQRAAGPSPSAAATEVGQGSKTWLLMADGEGDLSELSEMLSAQGQSTVRVGPGPCYTQRSETEFTVAPADAADVVRVLQRLSDRGDLLRGVVFARGLATGSASCPPVAEWPATALSACTDLVHLVQSLASVGREPRPRLWIVTRAAQPVMEDASRLRLWQSPLWGIGKVIALEHPELWGGMVDLDPSPAPGEFAAVLDEIQRPDGEDVVALRGQQRFAARLVPSDSQPECQLPVAGDGSYLITGGCGAFGLQAAAWLVNRGARHLLLVGRRGASTSEAAQAIAGLEQAGAEVWVEAADVSDEKCMRRVLSRLTENGRRLRGVIHAAGLPGYRPLAELDDATLRESFSAKVAGTWILHRVTEPFDLDFFVGCSSMVSVWGAKGQGHYVAANHFLDVYAHFRRGLGRHGLSVNWGPLTGGGMLPPEDVAELNRIGVSTSPLDQAVAALGRLPGTELIQTVWVDIDWRLFKSVYEARRPRPLFELVGSYRGGRPQPRRGRDGSMSASPPGKAGTNGELVRSLREATPAERRELLADHVQHEVAAVLGLDETVSYDTGFFDLGMDSLTAMDFKTRLEKTLELPLPSTLAFDYSTLETLVDYLAAEHLGSGAPAEDAPKELVAASVWEVPNAGESPPRVDIDQISEDEAEHLLMEKLAELGRRGR